MKKKIDQKNDETSTEPTTPVRRKLGFTKTEIPEEVTKQIAGGISYSWSKAQNIL